MYLCTLFCIVISTFWCCLWRHVIVQYVLRFLHTLLLPQCICSEVCTIKNNECYHFCHQYNKIWRRPRYSTHQFGIFQLPMLFISYTSFPDNLCGILIVHRHICATFFLLITFPNKDDVMRGFFLKIFCLISIPGQNSIHAELI